MNKIKLFLVAAAMVASPAMADAGNISPAYGDGWWDGWMGVDVIHHVNGTVSATGAFVGDVGKGAVQTAADIGEGAVDVAGEVAGTVIVDIPVGLVEAAGNAVAFNSWKEYWFF